MAGPFDSAADEIDATDAIYDSRLAGRLLRFLGPYRREVVLSVLLLAAISALEVAGPYLTKVAIDTYVKPASGRGVLPADASRGLLLIAGAYVSVLAGAFALRYAQSYMMSMVGQRAMRDLRLAIFRHLGTLSPGYYDTRPVGQILTPEQLVVAVVVGVRLQTEEQAHYDEARQYAGKREVPTCGQRIGARHQARSASACCWVCQLHAGPGRRASSHNSPRL